MDDGEKDYLSWKRFKPCWETQGGLLACCYSEGGRETETVKPSLRLVSARLNCSAYILQPCYTQDAVHSGIRWRWWFYNLAKLLKTTGLYVLKGWIYGMWIVSIPNQFQNMLPPAPKRWYGAAWLASPSHNFLYVFVTKIWDIWIYLMFAKVFIGFESIFYYVLQDASQQGGPGMRLAIT